jgi:hypothetical protein
MPAKESERSVRIYQQRQAGMFLKDIAAQEGLSIERIRQLEGEGLRSVIAAEKQEKEVSLGFDAKAKNLVLSVRLYGRIASYLGQGATWRQVLAVGDKRLMKWKCFGEGCLAEVHEVTKLLSTYERK